jgi:transposase-like protein
VFLVVSGYPKDLEEFEAWFPSDASCREYLARLRWSNGFVCPRCGSSKAWVVGSLLHECSKCHYQTSVIAGTIFQDTHKPLTLWFRAIWWVTGQKNGASALGLKRMLGLGSYRTAWTWLHKLRRAMVRPGRDRLSGVVEVDETYVGGVKPGKRGRGASGKALVGIAVEDKGEKGIGRIRLGILEDASSDSITPFVQERVEAGSTIRTDDWGGYTNLTSEGYSREIASSTELKLVHLAASLLKRWLLGTHQGAVSAEHLRYYLDEYTFRFNRRTSTHRGMLFMRLLQNAVQIDPTTYHQMIQHVRGRKPGNHNI